MRNTELDTKMVLAIIFELLPKSMVLFDGNKDKDVLFSFWKKVKDKTLPDKCVVVFINCHKDQLWEDLSVYPGVRIGTGYVLLFDTITNPGVKPSQRGLFFRS